MKMKQGFKISTLISFTISNHFHPHKFSPRLFSSSYNNRFTDGSSSPPPRRRRSGDGDSSFPPSNRPPSSSSRLSGFIDNDRGENRGRGRRDFDNNNNRNRNPRYDNDSDSRITPSNRIDNRKPEGNGSYKFFDDDDEQKPQFSPNRNHRKVNDYNGSNDNKNLDVDGFLDRFKLGFDNKKKPDVVGVPEETVSPPEETVSSPEDSDEIFRKMKETGLIPNAVAMLHGLCNDGLVNEAMKLFGVMRERGSIPEVIIYTAVVEGFCKSQKPDEAIRIFRKMQNNGIIPNAFSYNVLVQGLVKGKRLDDGFDFCLEMVDAGHSPNLATFTGLVNAFCRERGLESGQVVISKLKENGFGFDEKSVRDFMEKKGPFSPLVWEAILGKKSSQMFG